MAHPNENAKGEPLVLPKCNFLCSYYNRLKLTLRCGYSVKNSCYHQNNRWVLFKFQCIIQHNAVYQNFGAQKKIGARSQ